MRYALVLPCGGRKKATSVPVMARDLYIGPLWSTYRKYAVYEGAENAFFDVFVLSAEHGLLPETALILPYDRVMVRDGHRGAASGSTPVRRVGEIVERVRAQVERHHLRKRPVVFIGEGDGPYRAVLRLAGVSPIDLESRGRGIGDYRSDLRALLEGAAEAVLDQ